MPAFMTRPYYVGETAQVVAPDNVVKRLVVTSPAGQETEYHRDGTSPVAVELNQVGVWTYEWASHGPQTMVVAAPPSPPDAVPVGAAARRWRGV